MVRWVVWSSGGLEDYHGGWRCAGPAVERDGRLSGWVAPDVVGLVRAWICMVIRIGGEKRFALRERLDTTHSAMLGWICFGFGREKSGVPYSVPFALTVLRKSEIVDLLFIRPKVDAYGWSRI